MELELIHYVIAISGGFVAGVINTLAGYGSIITLTILMDVIGLPGNVANGTNRVNVLATAIGGSIGFYRNGKVDLNKGKGIIITVFLGALLGVLLAVSIDSDQFKSVFKYLVLVLFLAILVNPRRWIQESTEIKSMPVWKLVLIYLPIGFYAGFIQMGAGILFLMSTVLISKYSIMQANALKLIAVAFFTIMTLTIFHINGFVDWKVGSILAIGQFLGAFLTANFAPKMPNANLYAYRFLIVVVLFVILRTFGVLEMFIAVF